MVKISNLLAMGSLCFVASCAPEVMKTTFPITTPALIPAKYTEASQIKSIAVLPFTVNVEGKDTSKESTEFASQLESVLASVIIDDKSYFKLVDRLTVNRVIQEQRFKVSVSISEDEAVKIGKFIGVRGIYTGILYPVTKSERKYQEERVECDKKGNCTKKYVPCMQRKLTFSFIPRLIDVETGRVVYSRTISVDKVSYGCEGSFLESFEELERAAKKEALMEFIKDVAPHYVNMKFDLVDSEDNIKSREDRKKFNTALEFAKKNRIDRACSIWGEIYEKNQNSISLTYNLGVCKELSGDLAGALNFYQMADSLTKKPIDLINEALTRVKLQIERQERLKQQMRDS